MCSVHTGHTACSQHACLKQWRMMLLLHPVSLRHLVLLACPHGAGGVPDVAAVARARGPHAAGPPDRAQVRASTAACSTPACVPLRASTATPQSRRLVGSPSPAPCHVNM